MKCERGYCGGEAEVRVVDGSRRGKNVYSYICKKCAADFVPCEKCGVLINSYNSENDDCYIDGRWICFDCISQSQMKKCNHCGHFVFDEHDLCVRCARDVYIAPYSFKPRPHFYDNEDGILKNLFVGIELEMNFDDVSRFKDFLETYHNDDFVYLKRDGSISSKGVEIVSHPATFKYHFHHEWKNIFDMFKNTNTLGCGLHLHLSKNAFTDKEVEFLDYFINNCTYAITQIGSRALENYCRRVRVSHYGYKRRSSHMDACNLTNDNTIELRFCNSTHNYRSFIKKLKGIYALILFVKTVCRYNRNNVYMKKNNLKVLEKHFEHFKEELLSRI